ncbi:MAG: DUF1214 domain-containing protein [Hoeflea sp.]|nr:DUF1214 domain-containing protein [Hoeflea sp.]
MFRLPVLVLLTLVIAFGGGAWSASWMLKATSGFGAIDLGTWSAYPDLQTSKADPFAKAHRAGDGRILLGRAEGLVFTAEADETGAALSGKCAYEISGTTPPARFWTLRIADAADAPLAAEARFPATLNSWTTLRRIDGAFSIRVNATPEPGNWIRLDASGPVRFILTLIDTPAASSSRMVDLDMPSISLIGCRDA